MADRVEDGVRDCQSPQNLNTFTVVELKDYLRKRDLNLSGTKGDLCEKVFYAHKLEVPKCISAQDKANIKKQTCKQKLNVENGRITLPFPDDLNEGWQTGSSTFPDTTDNEVKTYLKDAPKSILKGKSLESSGDVFNVECHTISPNIKYCFVRGKCVPQEKTHNKPYEPWICLHKESGEVVTAECNCVAGLGEVCKHVGALLIHIASEVSNSKNKTCTSLPQAWGHPSAGARKKYGPKKLSEIRVKKAKKCPLLSAREQRTADRSSFDPRSLKDRTPMQFTNTDWRNLAVASNGNCGILLYKNPYLSLAGQEPDVNCVVHEEIVSTETTEEPMPLIHQAKVVAQVYFTVEEQCEQLIREFSWSCEQSKIVATKSKSQSCNSTWALYRVGIITASRLLSVLRKADADDTVKDQQSTDNLTIQILGYNKDVKTKAMNWGLMNEPMARKRYTTILQKCHTNFSVSETGLVLSVDWPYIGASPDAVVQCSCCGPGAAEFKVTWTHREKTIKEFAQVQSTCLHIRNGNVDLKNTHEYFYQAQTVMAVLKVSYLDFFLLTSVDEHLERIDFDRELWQQALPRLFSFFRSCIVPELFTKRLLKQLIVKELIIDIIDSVVSFNH